jgi:hypothetical protein
MPPIQIALVPYDVDPLPEDFYEVAAALQTQATCDVAPIWGVHGIISPFPKIEQVPPGYFPLLLAKDPPKGRGYHVPGQDLSFAVVQWQEGTAWSLLASHEMIEMLVDPAGSLTASAWTPKDGWRQYVVEVCDPCQDVFYLIGDVAVSDFVTPDYYRQAMARDVRYSFTGALDAPLDVTNAGSCSWRTPDGQTVELKGNGARRAKDEHLDSLHLASIATRGAESTSRFGPYSKRLQEAVDEFLRGDRSQGRPQSQRRPQLRASTAFSGVASQDDRVFALLEQLANPAYTTYAQFKHDPAQVYALFDIEPPDQDTLDKLKAGLAPPTHFQRVVSEKRTGLLGGQEEMNHTQTHAGFHSG